MAEEEGLRTITEKESSENEAERRHHDRSSRGTKE